MWDRPHEERHIDVELGMFRRHPAEAPVGVQEIVLHVHDDEGELVMSGPMGGDCIGGILRRAEVLRIKHSRLLCGSGIAHHLLKDTYGRFGSLTA